MSTSHSEHVKRRTYFTRAYYRGRFGSLGSFNEQSIYKSQRWKLFTYLIIQPRMHFVEQVAKNGGQPPGIPPPYVVDLTQHDSNVAPPSSFPYPNGPIQNQVTAIANDFRARFHRSIVAPTSFRHPPSPRIKQRPQRHLPVPPVQLIQRLQ